MQSKLLNRRISQFGISEVMANEIDMVLHRVSFGQRHRTHCILKDIQIHVQPLTQSRTHKPRKSVKVLLESDESLFGLSGPLKFLVFLHSYSIKEVMALVSRF